MKKTILSLLLLLIATTMNAQTILKGDMNDDGQLTISDVTSVVNVILGKTPVETINVGGSPYAIDNSMVVGTWYAPDGTHFTLNEDGTTDYGTGFTYKFRPYQGTLLIFNASGSPVKTFVLNEVESSYLLAVNYATGTYTYYTNSASLVTGLTMSESTLAMNSGTTAQLSVTATPAEAFNPHVTWSSSDESIATVDQNGLVTALVGGMVTITATATDGSGQLATCTITITQMVTSITLSETTLALELDGYKKLTATVLPDNAANKKVTWSSNNDEVAEVTSAGGVAAVGRGTCTITCTAQDGSGVTAICEVTVYRDESGTIDGRDYVDLDLPSGTLWATCNVGATSPEDYGDYFAWGETEGFDSGKTTFNWSTYKWCNGSEDTMTKYCSNSTYGNNGFTDNLAELEPEDDAAYVSWGTNWRMPSYDQCDELMNRRYTTTETATENGVNGIRITSKTNGNSIFLPAAGQRLNSTLFSTGDCFYYWSRTVQKTRYSYNAYFLYYYSAFVLTVTDRYYGQPVRPVRSSE